MLGLFGKKKSPEERLEDCRKKGDWDGLARAYYDLGTAAMDRGDLNQAVLWLHRADTVYSASDDVYEKAGEKRLFREEIVSGCSERIGTLEDAPLLYNDVPAEVEEKAEELNDVQIRVWGLLSIARLVKLGERLGRFPGCEALGKLGWAVEVMFKSFQEPITLLSALSQDQEPPAAESSMVGCTLLPDYYVRTGAGKLEDVPQIKAELERIWDDYEFVCSQITWQAVAQRLDGYRTLDILQ